METAEQYYKRFDLEVKISKLRDQIYIHTQGWAKGKMTDDQIKVLQQEFEELNKELKKIGIT